MLRHKPSQKKGCIDVITPAHSEGPRLAQSLDNLLCNPYFHWVICVNDSFTDNTEAVMVEVRRKWGSRFVAVTQKNTGKGGALMNGLDYATCDQIFLSDVDTYVPPDQSGMSYVLAEIECGVDAVGGILSTVLKGASLLLHIRATIKLSMIVMKRTLQQLLDDVPPIISGACGTFRTDVLREFGFSDCTKVGSPGLTWTLAANGYRIWQANHCIVYLQGCNSSRGEWRRQWRWIVGYAVCVRLHKKLLFSRFGIPSIPSMLLVVLYGIGIYPTTRFNEPITTGSHDAVLAMLSFIWAGVVYVIGTLSTWFCYYWLLVPLAPLFVVYALLAYTIWVICRLIASFTGHEPQRDKLTRYSILVKAPTTYSYPSVTGTEKPSEV